MAITVSGVEATPGQLVSIRSGLSTPRVISNLTAAGIASAASSSSLVAGALYVASDTGALYYAPSESVANQVSYSSAEPGYRGQVSEWGDLYLLESPSVGDQAIVLSVVGLSNVVVMFDGSTWRPTRDLLVHVADRVSGVTSASEQINSGWVMTCPAGFLSAFRRLTCRLTASRNNTTHNLDQIRFRVGTSSTYTNNTLIGETPGGMLSGSNLALVRQWEFERVSNVSIRSVFAFGTATLLAGGTVGEVSTAPLSSAVTVSNLSDAVQYLSVGVLMSGTSTTPSLSVTWKLEV